MDNATYDEGMTTLGLRITNSADLEQARWLVQTAGTEAVRNATHDLTGRHRPRAMKVIAYLGLERRKIPRPDMPAANAIAAHQRHRLKGWGPKLDD